MRKGQSTLEFAILIVIVAVALLAMQGYIKRSIQGNWRRAVDDLGSDHYEPRSVRSDSNYFLSSNATSHTFFTEDPITCAKSGCYANRADAQNTYEIRNISENIAGYSE